MSQQPSTKKLTDKDRLTTGDRVIVDKNKKGQIRWIGENKKLGVGYWYGIRLTEPRGVCNGTYKGEEFFWCPDRYGLVVQRKRITARYLLEDYDFHYEKKPNEEDPTLALIRKKRQELKKMKKKFRDMDKNDDLLVNVEEFGKIVSGKDGLFPKMTKNEVKKLFNEIDTTKSKKISYAEFDGWVKKLGGIHVLEHKDFVKIRQKFKDMDKDGDSKITQDEFLEAACSLYPKLTKVEAAHLFGEIDTSGDGVIQFSEYDEWCKKQQE